MTSLETLSTIAKMHDLCPPTKRALWAALPRSAQDKINELFKQGLLEDEYVLLLRQEKRQGSYAMDLEKKLHAAESKNVALKRRMESIIAYAISIVLSLALVAIALSFRYFI